LEEQGSCRSKLIEPRRALILGACLALFATWAAPATTGGPTPDPAPKKASGPGPDPAPQANPAPSNTATQAASTSQPLTASVATPTAQSTVTASHHQAASTPAPARVARRPVARAASPTAPPPSVLRRAARALGALTFSRLAADVRGVDVPSAGSSPDQGLLILGGTILLLIALGEVGFLTASVRLLRR
jgi:hypothetical protein